jgi:hypothetical protein
LLEVGQGNFLHPDGMTGEQRKTGDPVVGVAGFQIRPRTISRASGGAA